MRNALMVISLLLVVGSASVLGYDDVESREIDISLSTGRMAKFSGRVGEVTLFARSSTGEMEELGGTSFVGGGREVTLRAEIPLRFREIQFFADIQSERTGQHMMTECGSYNPNTDTFLHMRPLKMSQIPSRIQINTEVGSFVNEEVESTICTIVLGIPYYMGRPLG
jgi:hypothetical protein